MTPSRSGADRTGGIAAGLCFALVCAVTLLAYARSFSSSFQLDDNSQIIANPVMARPSVQGILEFGGARVVPFVTLVLNYRLGGEEPFGYHVVNFAIHLLATLAVFRLALALCRTPRLRDTWLAAQSLAFATAAAFVFACHPIQIQAVTYVVQRMSAMAAMFYVGSVVLYVRARNAQLGLGPGRVAWAYVGSALLALGAFFSKENAASLPLAILLTELAFYPSADGGRLLRLAPFAALVLVIPLTWWMFGIRPGYRFDPDAPVGQHIKDLLDLLIFRASPGSHVTSLEYALTQAVVIPRYLRMVVLPWGFNVDHDVPTARALAGPVFGGLAVLAGLLGCALWAWRRSIIIAFAILWLFVGLSVESSVLPIRDAMVEHRIYLAMPGVALIAGWVFAWTFQRRRATALIFGAACVLLLASLTFARNEVWRTPLALWTDALAKSPNKARVQVNIGTALHDQHRLDEAIAHYCQALALDPDHRQARHNLDVALAQQLEQRAERGEDIDAIIGPDGSFQVARPDPCSQ